MPSLARLIGITLNRCSLMIGASVNADQVFAKAEGCVACHQLEAKIVGPAYKAVAAKYKAETGTATTLADKIKSGGVGTWGQIPMPPQATLSDTEVATLVAWILSMSPMEDVAAAVFREPRPLPVIQ